MKARFEHDFTEGDLRKLRGRMGRSGMATRKEVRVWADALIRQSLDAIPARREPRVPLAHAETMLKRAATRLKRATTLHKKWQTSVTRLRRRRTVSEPDVQLAVAASRRGQ